jgi:hypothetical protein
VREDSTKTPSSRCSCGREGRGENEKRELATRTSRAGRASKARIRRSWREVAALARVEQEREREDEQERGCSSAPRKPGPEDPKKSSVATPRRAKGSAPRSRPSGVLIPPPRGRTGATGGRSTRSRDRSSPVCSTRFTPSKARGRPDSRMRVARTAVSASSCQRAERPRPGRRRAAARIPTRPYSSARRIAGEDTPDRGPRRARGPGPGIPASEPPDGAPGSCAFPLKRGDRPADGYGWNAEARVDLRSTRTRAGRSGGGGSHEGAIQSSPRGGGGAQAPSTGSASGIDAGRSSPGLRRGHRDGRHRRGVIVSSANDERHGGGGTPRSRREALKDARAGRDAGRIRAAGSARAQPPLRGGATSRRRSGRQAATCTRRVIDEPPGPLPSHRGFGLARSPLS